jgi:hypothetical protein
MFLFSKNFRLTLWAHPTFYSMGSFAVVKRLVREVAYSLTPSAEVKKKWSYNSTPPYAFMQLNTHSFYSVDEFFMYKDGP